MKKIGNISENQRKILNQSQIHLRYKQDTEEIFQQNSELYLSRKETNYQIIIKNT